MKTPLSFFSPGRHWPSAAVALLAGSLAFSQTPTPPAPTACSAPDSWFPHAQTPAPKAQLFPGNTTATDCDFHRWAWQEFLYATQTEHGRPRFMNYPTDADLFPSDPTAKPAKAATLQARQSPPPLQLRVRTIKSRAGGQPESAGSIVQAGSGGILVAEDGNPVFYSIHLNWAFYDFVESNSYYDYATYIATSPHVTFPIGAVEFKASWKILPAGATFAGYTTSAEVPTLSANSSGAIVAGLPMRTVTVGLVGFHVVGVVANHPEFIWATFEQKSNAPDLPPAVKPDSDTPVSASTFTFYAAGTAANACNALPSSYTLDAQTQTLSPITQVFRQYAYGGGTATNTTAIRALNQSVLARLPPADPASNYFLVGGVWLLPGALKPNFVPGGSDLHGSQDLSNSTMETFIQPPAKNQQPPPKFFTSCLACHDTAPTNVGGLSTNLPIPAMNMNLSHVLTDGLVTRELTRRALAP